MLVRAANTRLVIEWAHSPGKAIQDTASRGGFKEAHWRAKYRKRHSFMELARGLEASQPADMRDVSLAARNQIWCSAMGPWLAHVTAGGSRQQH